jgi:hypothetical protein
MTCRCGMVTANASAAELLLDRVRLVTAPALGFSDDSLADLGAHGIGQSDQVEATGDKQTSRQGLAYALCRLVSLEVSPGDGLSQTVVLGEVPVATVSG